jgi:hypothetical protein
MNFPIGKFIDHINGNSLDNRKSNLRICAPSENSGNSRGHRDSLTGYKGVTFDKQRQKWVATIQGRFLGRFEKIEDAGLAYDLAAKKVFGEFAKTNF